MPLSNTSNSPSRGALLRKPANFGENASPSPGFSFGAKPRQPFSFGLSPESTPPPLTPTPAAPLGTPAPAPFDIQGYINAMMQMQQSQIAARQQSGHEQLSGRHLGMSGNDINPATGREAGNPFDTGFFKSSAAQLSPEQLAQSQGGNAMNQWANPSMFPGAAPSPQTNQQAAEAASPPPFQLSPESSAAVHGYTAPQNFMSPPPPRAYLPGQPNPNRRPAASR